MGHILFHELPEPLPAAMEMDADGDLRDAEGLADLPVGETLDLAQDDDALVGLADLGQGRQQPPAEAPGLGQRLRTGLGGGHLLRGLVVEARRQPGRRLAPPLAQQVVAGVAGDPQQPGAEALLVHPLAMAPEPEQHLLGHVLGLLPAGEQVAGEGVDPASIALRGVLESRQHPMEKTDGRPERFRGLCPRSVLPFESSPPGPLSTSWRGGTCLQHPAELNKAFLRGPSLSTKWRGTEGEASEGRRDRGQGWTYEDYNPLCSIEPSSSPCFPPPPFSRRSRPRRTAGPGGRHPAHPEAGDDGLLDPEEIA